MTTGDDKLIVRTGGTDPVVRLRRITRIDTFEVMQADLDALDTATEKEGQALGFFTASGGALVSALLSWFGLTTPTAAASAVYAAVGLVLAFSTVFFGVSWRRERAARRTVMDRIRSCARVVEHEQVIANG